MPEALISALSVILALIGLITLIYGAMVRIFLYGRHDKIVIILPVDDEDDPASVFACQNMLKAYPLFSGDLFEVTVSVSDDTYVSLSKDSNDILETDTTKLV